MAGYEPLSRAELVVLLAERDHRIAQLQAENEDLARRVARLERLVSRNSGNSSFPPSADDLPGRVPFIIGCAPTLIDTRYVLQVTAAIELLTPWIAGASPFSAPGWERR